MGKMTHAKFWSEHLKESDYFVHFHPQGLWGIWSSETMVSYHTTCIHLV